MNQYIAAIDQGTTSSRCMIFDHDGAVVSVAQKEHEQIFPRAGWVEHDPVALWINTREVVAGALAKVDLTRADIAAVGITNQRETTVVWERSTGKPIYNAIVWQDTRTDQLCVELGGDEVRTSIETRPDYHSRPTSLGRRSAGFSTTSTVRKQKRRPANCASALSTRGSCGT